MTCLQARTNQALLCAVCVTLLATTSWASLLPSWANPIPQVADDDWPMLGHDLARSNATSHALDPSPGPNSGRPVWVRDFASGDQHTSEVVFSEYQPIVVNGLVYVGTSRNNLYALNAETGDIVWAYDGDDPGMITASPAVVNGVLYYAATNGRVYALDATSGHLVWNREIVKLGGFRTSPAVYEGVIYLGAEDGVFYAVRADDGAVVGRYDTGAPILNTAAIDVNGAYPGRIYSANEAGYAFALVHNRSQSDPDQALVRVWQSPRLTGLSTRYYYPVIADGGRAVLLRTAPGPARRVLAGGDTLLARAAGLSVPDWTRITVWDNTYGVDLYAPYAPVGFDAEQDAIVHWLAEEYPEYRTFHVLNADSGSIRLIAPVLWSGPGGNVGEPPVVAPDSTLYVRARSYYGNFDGPSAYVFGTPARLDLATGRTQLIRLPSDNQAFQTGIFVISDESSAMSLAGNRLFFYGHGDAVGTVQTDGTDPWPITISRDVPHTIVGTQRSPNLPFGQLPTTMGPDRGTQPPTIAEGKVFFVSRSMVGMYRPGFNGETRYIAASGGSQPSTGPIPIPDASDLQTYVTEIEAYPFFPGASAEAKAELEAQIADLTTGGRYRPFIQLIGKMPGYIFYVDPTEEAYILAIAYPYLPSGLQAQVRSYLQALWAEVGDPLNYNYPYRYLDGRRRERYDVDNDAGNYAADNGVHYYFSNAPNERLYNLWAYAHYVGDWDLIVRHWNAIASVAHSVNPESLESGRPPYTSMNRRVASLIGYARLADHLRQAYPDNTNYQNEFEWALDAATRGLRARLQWEETHRPTGTPWSEWWIRDTDQFSDRFLDAFMNTGWGRGGQIPRYNGLVPAIAHVLRDYAWDDVRLQNDFVDTVTPAQHLAWSYAAGFNEIASNLPSQAREIFLVKAEIMGADAETLSDYLSAPWCWGDLYYIERLVWILRNSAPTPGMSVSASTADAGDVLTYDIVVVGTGQHATIVDPLPSGVTYVNGSLRYEPAVGTMSAEPSQISWSGTLPENTALRLTFDVVVSSATPSVVVNRAYVNDGLSQYTLSAVTLVNGIGVYLPIVQRTHNP